MAAAEGSHASRISPATSSGSRPRDSPCRAPPWDWENLVIGVIAASGRRARATGAGKALARRFGTGRADAAVRHIDWLPRIGDLRRIAAVAARTDRRAAHAHRVVRRSATDAGASVHRRNSSAVPGFHQPPTGVVKCRWSAPYRRAPWIRIDTLPKLLLMCKNNFRGEFRHAK